MEVVDQQVFTNLWELKYEPSLVRIDLTIESSNESNLDLHRSMEFLLNKIISIEWHDNPYDSPNQSETIIKNNYNYFQSIQFEIEKKTIESDESKGKLISAIGYFS